MSYPTPKGAFVLDVDDPYVYDLVKAELCHYQSSFDLIEPRHQSLPTNTTGPQESFSADVPTTTPTPHHHRNLTVYHDPEDDTYNNRNKQQHTIYYTEYEKVDWDAIDFNPLFTSTVWYTNRKGLIRKAELVKTITNHIERCECAEDKEMFGDQCDEILDDENWYYFSDVDGDSDDDNGDELYEPQSTETEEGGKDQEDETQSDEDETQSDEDEESEVDSGEKKYVPRVFKGGEGCCPLQSHVPHSISFSLFSANELDELLISELPEILALDDRTDEENLINGNMWILKPSLTNQAKGISLITSSQSLRDVFLGDHLSEQDKRDAISIRDWVIQRYIHPPLLLNGRKFHLRVYVLASGCLNVYIFDRFLALFSLKDYPKPSSPTTTTTRSTDPSSTSNLPTKIDPSIHITNTCYQKRMFLPEHEQDQFDEEKCVMLFHEAIEQWSNQYLAIISPQSTSQPKHAISRENLPGSITVQKLGLRALRSTLRQLNSIFLSSQSADQTDHAKEDDYDPGPQTTDQLYNFPQHFSDSYALFLFFFKRVMRQYQHYYDFQSTAQPDTAIASIFNSSTNQLDFAQLSKQIAIQMYSHVLNQIKVILQELFLACIDHTNGHRFQIEPPMNVAQSNAPTNQPVLDLFQFNTIVDDRLDGDELKDKNDKLFQSLSATPLNPTDRLIQNTQRRSMMNNKYKPLQNCIEIYGFDFMVDHRCKVYLIEANPGPDFGQTGVRLKSIVCQPLVSGLISILLQQKKLLVQRQLGCDGDVDRDKEVDMNQLAAKRQVVNQVSQFTQRDVPLGVQFSATIVAEKYQVNSTQSKSGDSGQNLASQQDRPTFNNIAQVAQVNDYIGTRGETTWSNVMPTAPHFLPILHIPL